VLAAAQRAEARGWTYVQEAQTATVARLAEKGVAIGSIPPEVMAGLNQIGSTMTEEWIAKVGEDGRKLVDALKAA
jgi:TRAP-type transport system periplasmic protein